MSTGPHDRLRGPTPPRPRPTAEYGPTKAARDERPSLPAELSGMHEMLRDALSELLTERSQSAESMIAARVKVDTQHKTRHLRLGLGGLGAALVAALSWGVAQVESYGNSRAAAAEAAWEAKEEAARATAKVDAAQEQARVATERLDNLEPKVDRALTLLEALADRPIRLDVKPEPKPRRRGDP